ncbi:hypothetical protein [Macrococcoides caseolyticum]|uniref:hypothetical protein n=1 Tax=Macrococcoides caseolyticum TaxID=69966 RepID=UPI003F5F5CAC
MRVYHEELLDDLEVTSSSQNKTKLKECISKLQKLNFIKVEESNKKYILLDCYYFIKHRDGMSFTMIYLKDLEKIFKLQKDKKSFMLYLHLLYRNNSDNFLLHRHTVEFLADCIGYEVRSTQQAIRTLIDNNLLIQNHNGVRSPDNKIPSDYLVFNAINTYSDYAEVCELMREKPKGMIGSEEIEQIEYNLQNEVFEKLKSKYKRKNPLVLKDMIEEIKEKNIDIKDVFN